MQAKALKCLADAVSTPATIRRTISFRILDFESRQSAAILTKEVIDWLAVDLSEAP